MDKERISEVLKEMLEASKEVVMLAVMFMYACTALIDVAVIAGYVERNQETVSLAVIMTLASLKSAPLLKEKLFEYHERS